MGWWWKNKKQPTDFPETKKSPPDVQVKEPKKSKGKPMQVKYELNLEDIKKAVEAYLYEETQYQGDILTISVSMAENDPEKLIITAEHAN